VLELDLRDLPALEANLKGRVFDGVFHFAAKSLVGESNTDPMMYYQNNVGGTANLLEVALQNGWHHFVLSSTAAVYGNPITELISEDHPKKPVNVYGDTKLSMEKMLEALCSSSELSAVCLRYFNAAGAADDGSIGEWHEPETHLIPNALRAASGTEPSLTNFGTDYPTSDGTCIRDYIHVEDLADAHLKAMACAQDNSGFHAFNLGNGKV
jgi:UDP-glucose 4-epimerase